MMEEGLKNQFVKSATQFLQRDVGTLGNPTLIAKAITIKRVLGDQPVKLNAFTDTAAYLRAQFSGYNFKAVNGNHPPAIHFEPKQ